VNIVPLYYVYCPFHLLPVLENTIFFSCLKDNEQFDSATDIFLIVTDPPLYPRNTYEM